MNKGRVVHGREHHPNCSFPWQQCICVFPLNSNKPHVDQEVLDIILQKLNEITHLIKQLRN